MGLKHFLLTLFLFSMGMLAAQVAPGGQTANLVFWLKADAGTNTTTDGGTITDWDDQSGNANHAHDNGTGPIYRKVWNSYQPAVDFSNTASPLELDNDPQINSASSTAKTFFIAFQTGSDIQTDQIIYEEGGSFTGINLSIQSGDLHFNLYQSDADNADFTSIAANTTYIVGFVYDGAAGTWDAYLNGALAANDATAPSSLGSHTGYIGLGGLNGDTQFDGDITFNTGGDFNGQIMEMAYWNGDAFDATKRLEVRSYLAVKYGIALETDYSSTAASTYWDHSANNGYNDGIAGIGQDDDTDLHQKQGKSANGDALVAIGLGDVAVDNATNTASVGDGNFLLWGHDGDNLRFTPSAPSNYQRLNREWRVEETGSVGAVEFQVPAFSSTESQKLPDADTVFLFVDDDADMTSVGNIVPMSQNGDYWETSYDIPDGYYFGFGVRGTVLDATTNGNEAGPVDIIFTLTLPDVNTTGSAITFDFDDFGTGSATSGNDYTAIPAGAKISVANGASSGTYTVSVLDDLIKEPEETFIAQISNPSHGPFSIGADKATATLTDNDEVSPGGVVLDNVSFWLKANAGTNTTTDGGDITDWYDQSNGGNNFFDIGTDPHYKVNAFNFNPAIDFLNTDGLTMNDASNVNTSSSTAKSYCIVFKTGADITTRQLIYEEGGGTHGMNMYLENSELHFNHWRSSADDDDSTPISANTVYVASFVYDGGATDWYGYLNGTFSMADYDAYQDFPSHSGDVGIGEIDASSQFPPNEDVGSGEEFDGEVSEIIYYHQKALTASEREGLESYLALKYGLTLSDDYIASNNATILWDHSANNGYNNDIAGLATDALSQLSQKQSRSENTDALVQMGLGSIAATNPANTANFSSDYSYLLWGNDDEPLAAEASNSDLPSGIVDKLQRTWKIVETGSIDSVQIAVPKDSLDAWFPYGNIDEVLLVADDANFSTHLEIVKLSKTLLNGDSVYVGDYDFDGTQFFTFGQWGLIVWDGTEWRGGLSILNPHAPSDDAGDTLKDLLILAGDTARIDEAAQVTTVSTLGGAVLAVKPDACLAADDFDDFGGDFILEADATGFGQYHGPPVAATYQQYIEQEGWHHIGSPFSDTHFDDFAFENGNGFLQFPLGGNSLDSCHYCNLWWYDPSANNGGDIGFGATNAFGTWRTATDGSENFDGSKGWNLYLDESSGFYSAPWTVSVSGTLNDGTVNQAVNENNGGWNLVANPFPSVLDWDAVDKGLSAAGIAGGYHVWDADNSTFAVYSSGSGTLGLMRYVAPFQGFYVQTSTAGGQGSVNVGRTFTLDDADRPNTCAAGIGNVYKSTDNQLYIRTVHQNSNKKDETILRFENGAPEDFNPQKDIRKLFTYYKDVGAVYTEKGGERLAIAARDFPYGEDSVRLGVRAGDGDFLTIEAVETPPSWTVYLEDLKTEKWHIINDQPYEYQQDASFPDRFVLHFGRDYFEKREGEGNPFTAFFRDSELLVTTRKDIVEGDWQLVDLGGKILRRGSFEEGSGHRHSIQTGNLPKGIYIFMMEARGERFTEKIGKTR